MPSKAFPGCNGSLWEHHCKELNYGGVAEWARNQIFGFERNAKSCIPGEICGSGE